MGALPTCFCTDNRPRKGLVSAVQFAALPAALSTALWQSGRDVCFMASCVAARPEICRDVQTLQELSFVKVWQVKRLFVVVPSICTVAEKVLKNSCGPLVPRTSIPPYLRNSSLFKEFLLKIPP